MTFDFYVTLCRPRGPLHCSIYHKLRLATWLAAKSPVIVKWWSTHSSRMASLPVSKPPPLVHYVRVEYETCVYITCCRQPRSWTRPVGFCGLLIFKKRRTKWYQNAVNCVHSSACRQGLDAWSQAYRVCDTQLEWGERNFSRYVTLLSENKPED